MQYEEGSIRCSTRNAVPDAGPGRQSFAHDAMQFRHAPPDRRLSTSFRLLVADIRNLAPGTVAPSRRLEGSVLRPWCHFELASSDYLTSGEAL